MNLLYCYLSTITIIMSLSATSWAVTPTGPFEGQQSEGFETFNFGGLPGTSRSRSGPFCIFGNQAQLSGQGRTSPLFVWGGGFNLGSNGNAIVQEGERALHLSTVSSSDSTARLDFQAPIRDFGGYLAYAATVDRNDPATVTFLGANNELIATEEWTYDATNQGQLQWAGWTSEEPISAIELSGFYLGFDELQINSFHQPTLEDSCRDFGAAVQITNDTTVDENRSFSFSGLDLVDQIGRSVEVEIVPGGQVATGYSSPSFVRGANRIFLNGGNLGGRIEGYDEANITLSGGQWVYEPSDRTVRVSSAATDFAAMIINDRAKIDVEGGQFFWFEASAVIANDQSRVSVVNGELSGVFHPTIIANDNSTIAIGANGIVSSSEVAAIHARDSSTVRISGGEVEGDNVFRAFDSSRVEVSGGMITGEDGGVTLSQFSQAYVSGGTIYTDDGTGVGISDNAVLTVRGGRVSGDYSSVNAIDAGLVNINGGELYASDGSAIRVQDDASLFLWTGDVEARDDSAVVVRGTADAQIWGGAINSSEGAVLLATENATVHIRGGTIENFDDGEPLIMAVDNATIHIYGRDLATANSQVTGTFKDGSAIILPYVTEGSGQVVLHELTDLACDLDDDGSCQVTDIDTLIMAIEAGAENLAFDLNADGTVDVGDADTWLTQAAIENGFAAPYPIGDANLDGAVDQADLNTLGVHWQQPGKRWSEGNFAISSNTEFGVVDSHDLTALAVNWRQTVPQTAAVPEPGISLVVVVLLLGIGRNKRRTHVNLKQPDAG